MVFRGENHVNDEGQLCLVPELKVVIGLFFCFVILWELVSFYFILRRGSTGRILAISY